MSVIVLDPQQREYYKIFTGTNQFEGHEKIHLGYESRTREYILEKDKSTFFHVPYFTNAVSLTATRLIHEGAIPGPIPALSDRIYKKQAGYERNTHWGNSTRIDGTWLCRRYNRYSR